MTIQQINKSKEIVLNTDIGFASRIMNKYSVIGNYFFDGISLTYLKLHGEEQDTEKQENDLAISLKLLLAYNYQLLYQSLTSLKEAHAENLNRVLQNKLYLLKQNNHYGYEYIREIYRQIQSNLVTEHRQLLQKVLEEQVNNIYTNSNVVLTKDQINIIQNLNSLRSVYDSASDTPGFHGRELPSAQEFITHREWSTVEGPTSNVNLQEVFSSILAQDRKRIDKNERKIFLRLLSHVELKQDERTLLQSILNNRVTFREENSQQILTLVNIVSEYISREQFLQKVTQNGISITQAGKLAEYLNNYQSFVILKNNLAHWVQHTAASGQKDLERLMHTGAFHHIFDRSRNTLSPELASGQAEGETLVFLLKQASGQELAQFAEVIRNENQELYQEFIKNVSVVRELHSISHQTDHKDMEQINRESPVSKYREPAAGNPKNASISDRQPKTVVSQLPGTERLLISKAFERQKRLLITGEDIFAELLSGRVNLHHILRKEGQEVREVNSTTSGRSLSIGQQEREQKSPDNKVQEKQTGTVSEHQNSRETVHQDNARQEHQIIRSSEDQSDEQQADRYNNTLKKEMYRIKLEQDLVQKFYRSDTGEDYKPGTIAANDNAVWERVQNYVTMPSVFWYRQQLSVQTQEHNTRDRMLRILDAVTSDTRKLLWEELRTLHQEESQFISIENSVRYQTSEVTVDREEVALTHYIKQADHLRLAELMELIQANAKLEKNDFIQLSRQLQEEMIVTRQRSMSQPDRSFTSSIVTNMLSLLHSAKEPEITTKNQLLDLLNNGTTSQIEYMLQYINQKSLFVTTKKELSWNTELLGNMIGLIHKQSVIQPGSRPLLKDIVLQGSAALQKEVLEYIRQQEELQNSKITLLDRFEINSEEISAKSQIRQLILNSRQEEFEELQQAYRGQVLKERQVSNREAILSEAVTSDVRWTSVQSVSLIDRENNLSTLEAYLLRRNELEQRRIRHYMEYQIQQLQDRQLSETNILLENNSLREDSLRQEESLRIQSSLRYHNQLLRESNLFRENSLIRESKFLRENHLLLRSSETLRGSNPTSASGLPNRIEERITRQNYLRRQIILRDILSGIILNKRSITQQNFYRELLLQNNDQRMRTLRDRIRTHSDQEINQSSLLHHSDQEINRSSLLHHPVQEINRSSLLHHPDQEADQSSLLRHPDQEADQSSLLRHPNRESDTEVLQHREEISGAKSSQSVKKIVETLVQTNKEQWNLSYKKDSEALRELNVQKKELHQLKESVKVQKKMVEELQKELTITRNASNRIDMSEATNELMNRMEQELQVARLRKGL